MQASRRQSDEHVARLYTFSGDKIFAFHGAYDKPSEIIFAHRIETWHLGGLAADQRAGCFAAGAAHTLNELLDYIGIELTHREVVEKKQRLGALHQNVVDAMIYQVPAD